MEKFFTNWIDIVTIFSTSFGLLLVIYQLYFQNKIKQKDEVRSELQGVYDHLDQMNVKLQKSIVDTNNGHADVSFSEIYTISKNEIEHLNSLFMHMVNSTAVRKVDIQRGIIKFKRGFFDKEAELEIALNKAWEQLMLLQHFVDRSYELIQLKKSRNNDINEARNAMMDYYTACFKRLIKIRKHVFTGIFFMGNTGVKTKRDKGVKALVSSKENKKIRNTEEVLKKLPASFTYINFIQIDTDPTNDGSALRVTTSFERFINVMDTSNISWDSNVQFMQMFSKPKDTMFKIHKYIKDKTPDDKLNFFTQNEIENKMRRYVTNDTELKEYIKVETERIVAEEAAEKERLAEEARKAAIEAEENAKNSTPKDDQVSEHESEESVTNDVDALVASDTVVSVSIENNSDEKITTIEIKEEKTSEDEVQNDRDISNDKNSYVIDFRIEPTDDNFRIIMKLILNHYDSATLDLYYIENVDTELIKAFFKSINNHLNDKQAYQKYLEDDYFKGFEHLPIYVLHDLFAAIFRKINKLDTKTPELIEILKRIEVVDSNKNKESVFNRLLSSDVHMYCPDLKNKRKKVVSGYTFALESNIYRTFINPEYPIHTFGTVLMLSKWMTKIMTFKESDLELFNEYHFGEVNLTNKDVEATMEFVDRKLAMDTLQKMYSYLAPIGRESNASRTSLWEPVEFIKLARTFAKIKETGLIISLNEADICEFAWIVWEVANGDTDLVSKEHRHILLSNTWV